MQSGGPKRRAGVRVDHASDLRVDRVSSAQVDGLRVGRTKGRVSPARFIYRTGGAQGMVGRYRAVDGCGIKRKMDSFGRNRRGLTRMDGENVSRETSLRSVCGEMASPLRV